MVSIFFCVLQQNLRRCPWAANEILNTADKRTNQINNCEILLVQEPPIHNLSAQNKGFPSTATIISDTNSIPKAANIVLSNSISFQLQLQLTTPYCSIIKLSTMSKYIIFASIYFSCQF